MQHNSQLYVLAQEWAKLRQDVKTERDPDKLWEIIDRLKILLLEAERLVGLRSKSETRSGLDGVRRGSAEREIRG